MPAVPMIRSPASVLVSAVTLTLALALGGCGAGGADSSAGDADGRVGGRQSPPTFRAGTAVVPLDVRVLDKEGRPVTDLTVADFTVIEDGTPQRIEHFARQALTPESVVDDQPLQRRSAAITDALTPLNPVYLYGDRQIPAYIQTHIDAVFVGPESAPMRYVNAQLAGSAAEEDHLRQTYHLFNAPDSDEFSRVQRDTMGVGLSTFLDDTAQTMQDQSHLYAGIEYLRHLEGEKHLVWLAEYGLRRSFLTPEEFDRDLGRAAADARVVLNVIRAGGTEMARPGTTMTADIPGPRASSTGAPGSSSIS